MNEKIIRQYGNCEVTIVFGMNNPEVKDKTLWLMLENYHNRISEQSLLDFHNVAEEKKAF